MIGLIEAKSNLSLSDMRLPARPSMGKFLFCGGVPKYEHGFHIA